MASSKSDIIAELKANRTAIERILAVGQTTQVPGAFQVQQAQLQALYSRQAFLRGRLLSSGGAPSSLRPNYTGYSGGQDWVDP